MDLRGLTTKELEAYGNNLKKYLSNPKFAATMDEYGYKGGYATTANDVDHGLRRLAMIDAGPESSDKIAPGVKGNEAVRRFTSDAEAEKGIYNRAKNLTDAQKEYLTGLKNAKALATRAEDMTPAARAGLEADKAGIIEQLKYKNYFDQLTPKQKMLLKNYDPSAMVKAMPPAARAGLEAYDPSAIIKAMPSLEPMISKGGGTGLGKILQGGARVAQKVMPYVSGAGAALTAYDLGQALSEVQDKGAAKIAEDYKRSEDEKMGYSAMGKMNPISNPMRESKQYLEQIKTDKKGYSPEERAKLKDMLDKLRGNPKLRGSVSKMEYPTYNTPYDAVRDYLRYGNPQSGKEFDERNSYSDTKRV
jgi:hypothetical protein